MPRKAATTGSVGFKRLLLTCLSLIVCGAVLTVITNREPIFFGPLSLPGMQLWDLVSLISEIGIILVPFLIARSYLYTSDTHIALLKTIVLSALIYSLLILIEIRLSPQLHRWVYGYHQHSFLQHIRDGFRPMVFLQHGIWVGFFMFMSVIAAAGLWKATRETKWLCAALWLFAVLLVSRNLGALVICLLCGGIFFFLWQRAQILSVIIVAASLLIFPALRQANVVPIDWMVSAAAVVSEERAQSLGFRFYHEDLLLDRAYSKPWAGWGSWGRERVYDEDGEEVSISEGRWSQTIGQHGWIGYIGFFGVLTLPMLFLRNTAKRKDVPPETMALALIATGNLIYMIPNSTLTPVSLLVFGALAGFSQYDTLRKPKITRGLSVQSLRNNRYTRFPSRSNRSRSSAGS